jgi:NHL repeat
LGTLFVVAGGGGSNAPSTTAQSATAVSLDRPIGVAVDSSGNVYFADSLQNLIEKVTPGGSLSVIAGGGSNAPSTSAQPATSVSLDHPFGVAVDSSGNVYIADTSNSLIEEVTPGGSLSVIAGGGSNAPSATAESATSVFLRGPYGVAVDSFDNVYIADTSNCVVEEVTPGGSLSVVAGPLGGAKIYSTRLTWPWTAPATSTSQSTTELKVSSKR